MQLPIVLGTLCAIVVHTAGSAVAAPPTWCKGGDEKPTYDVKSLYTETDPHFALLGLVAASCYPEDDVAAQTAQIAKTRAAWSKKLGLVEADWADVSEWAHLQRHLRGDPKINETDRKAAWSKFTAIDQYGIMSTVDTSDVDAAYLADAFGTKLTQLGRLGYVMQCIGTNADNPAVDYAMCAADAAALDAAKVSAEIRADTTHSAGDRMTVRLVAYELFTDKLPKFNAAVKVLKDKDPAYAKMFELAAAAHTQWASTDAKLIALADDLDSARVTGSRKASQGCSARAWEAWHGAVAALPAKDLATIHAQPGNEFVPQMLAMMIDEPNGYLAALAMNECAVLEDYDDGLIGVIGGAIVRWPGFRGPRTGTQTAILTAGLQLDDRDAAIEIPKVHRDWIKGDGSTGVTGKGAIESVKVSGDKATITFAKEKVTQNRCVKGHYTNRISQIMGDGTVHYYYQCDKEVTETVEVAPSPPLDVKARYATGLKKGMVVQVTDDVAAVAYPKGKATPAVVTGVEVK